MKNSACRGLVALVCLSLACVLLLLGGGGGLPNGATAFRADVMAVDKDTQTAAQRSSTQAAAGEAKHRLGAEEGAHAVSAVLRTHPGSGFHFLADWIASRCLCRVFYTRVPPDPTRVVRNESDDPAEPTFCQGDGQPLLVSAQCTLEIQVVPVTNDVVAHAASAGVSLSEALVAVGAWLCDWCNQPTATFVRSSIAATCAAVRADRPVALDNGYDESNHNDGDVKGATRHGTPAWDVWGAANAASSACHSSAADGKSTTPAATARIARPRSATVTHIEFESTMAADVHEQKILLLRLLQRMFPTSRLATEARRTPSDDDATVALERVIDEDAHHFRSANRWWDSSESFLSPSATDASRRYLAANRQCARHGIFPHFPNKREDDNATAAVPFDERFSGLYSFQDREALYAALPSRVASPVAPRPIHCGFRTDSVWEEIREKFRHRSECEWVIFTVIIDCYDPLPIVQSEIPPKTCFVAFLDNRTYAAIGRTLIDRSFVLKRKRGQKLTRPPWEVINLGNLSMTSPFRWSVKTVEVIKLAAVRLFPLARRVFWLDGKAVLYHIPRVIRLAHGSVLLGMRSYFHDPRSKYGGKFDLSKEFLETRIHLAKRYGGNHTPTYRRIAREIDSQEAQYRKEGWFQRIAGMKEKNALDMMDIAAMSYAPTDPCAIRLTCAWMNEVCFYNYRGQLSLHYVLHRLRLVDFVRIDANFYLQAYFHHKVCDDRDRPITLVN